jgi:hypothetical protein
MAEENQGAQERLRIDVAEATQRALLEVARSAYEEAGLSGLCEEGRWEVAIGAMRSYDVRLIILSLTSSKR